MQNRCQYNILYFQLVTLLQDCQKTDTLSLIFLDTVLFHFLN